jgi:hypothetical protein
MSNSVQAIVYWTILFLTPSNACGLSDSQHKRANSVRHTLSHGGARSAIDSDVVADNVERPQNYPSGRRCFTRTTTTNASIHRRHRPPLQFSLRDVRRRVVYRNRQLHAEHHSNLGSRRRVTRHVASSSSHAVMTLARVGRPSRGPRARSPASLQLNCLPSIVAHTNEMCVDARSRRQRHFGQMRANPGDGVLACTHGLKLSACARLLIGGRCRHQATLRCSCWVRQNSFV